MATDVSRLGVSRCQPAHAFETVLLGQPHRPTQISGIRSRNFIIGLVPFAENFNGALQSLDCGSLTANSLTVGVRATDNESGHHKAAQCP